MIDFLNLIQRCDYLAIEAGRVALRPKNADACSRAGAEKWLSTQYDAVLVAILLNANIQAWRYTGYCVDKKEVKKGILEGTLTLKFIEVRTNAEAFACFNVELTRQRTTCHGKKGDPLPKGKFYPLPSGGFRKFWRIAVGDEPPEYHCYMGRLKRVALTGQFRTTGKSKLVNTSLVPLEITYEQLIVQHRRRMQTTDNSPITHRQLTDNSPIRETDKHTLERQCFKHSELNYSTGESATVKGNKVKGNTVTIYSNHSSTTLPASSAKKPEEQSMEEWLDEYVNTEDGGEANHKSVSMEGRIQTRSNLNMNIVKA